MLRSPNRRGGYIEPYLLGGGRQRRRRSLPSRIARALTSPIVLVALPVVAVVIIVLLW